MPSTHNFWRNMVKRIQATDYSMIILMEQIKNIES